MDILLTEEQCNIFMKNPTINPLTNRGIMKDGTTYNKLNKACQILYRELEKKKVQRDPSPKPKPKPNVNEEIKASPKKQILISVIGLGCSFVESHEIVNYEKIMEKTIKMPYKVFCNQSLKKTLGDIAKTYCSIKPTKKDTFMQSVFAVVNILLELGYTVHLLGHSYGGSIASRVAEMYNDTPEKARNLFIYTCGSIYVPDVKRTNHVNIKHYMFLNDVALKCNGLSRKVDKHVIWLRPEGYLTPSKKRRTVFGTKEEWESHNAYDFEYEMVHNKPLPVAVVS